MAAVRDNDNDHPPRSIVCIVDPDQALTQLNTLKELLALPRAETEKLSVGTSGLVSGPHMTLEWLRVKTGLTLNHVPYKGGGPSLADGVAGQIALVINALPAATPFIKPGRLKVLAVTSRERHPSLPNSPTVIESGVKDFVTWQWYRILGPAGVPRDIVATLNKEIHKAMASKEVKDRFPMLAFDAAPGTPEEFLDLSSEEPVERLAVDTRSTRATTRACAAA